MTCQHINGDSSETVWLAPTSQHFDFDRLETFYDTCQHTDGDSSETHLLPVHMLTLTESKLIGLHCAPHKAVPKGLYCRLTQLG